MNLNIKRFQEGDYVITEIDGIQTARDVSNDIVLPSWILDTPISPRAMLLYGLLHSFYHNRKKIFASNKFMADSLHVSERTISKLLEQLVNAGLLQINYLDDERRNRGEIFVIDPFYEAKMQRREELRLKKSSNAIEEKFSRDRRKVPHNTKVNTKNTTKQVNVKKSKKKKVELNVFGEKIPEHKYQWQEAAQIAYETLKLQEKDKASLFALFKSNDLGFIQSCVAYVIESPNVESPIAYLYSEVNRRKHR
jgi:hypothetical protein